MAHARRPTVYSVGYTGWPSISVRNAPDDPYSVQGVGPELRTARERRGQQINDVWLALRIPPNCLAAIEDGRFEDLHGRAITITYVARYARYLGLDVQDFVDRVDAEFLARGVADLPPLQILPYPERKTPPGALVAGGILLAGLAYFADDLSGLATRTYEQVVEAGSAQEAVAAPVLASVQQPAPLAAPEPAIPIASEIIVTPPVALAAGLAPIIDAPVPASGREYGLQNRNSRITLRVHSPTVVEVRVVRNRRIRTFIDRPLEPGDTYRVPSIGGLTLWAQDAGAVEIMLDGASVGFAGANGVAARGLSLTPQNLINRQRRG